MGKMEEYRKILSSLPDWDTFLLQESGLPGPRGNIELAQAVAEEGDLTLFLRYLECSADIAPVNSPHEFLAFCGTIGLGRLLAEGDESHWPALRQCAADSRWRMREATAMALQRLGDLSMDRLIAEMTVWSQGSLLEKRAAAAALCEPRLLKDKNSARSVLKILDSITGSLLAEHDRHSEDFLTLRQGLAYCWSVAVAALPEEGKLLMEKWLVSTDKDIRWIMRENLKKNRLNRMDAAWTGKWLGRIT